MKDPEKLKAAQLRYRLKHPERVVLAQKRCYAKYAAKRKAYSKLYRQTHPEETRANKKAWNRAHPDRTKVYRQKYRAENTAKVIAKERLSNRKRRGIPNPTSEIRIGHCPLCMRDGLKLVPDHDHDTKQSRDWLCNVCNLIEGNVAKREKISPGWSARVIAYQAKWKKLHANLATAKTAA